MFPTQEESALYRVAFGTGGAAIVMTSSRPSAPFCSLLYLVLVNINNSLQGTGRLF